MKNIIGLIILVLFSFPFKSYADECLEGDCKNGFGKKRYDTYQIYEGHFKSGKKQGLGKLSLPLGRTLKGKWKDDKIVSGIKSYQDGREFTGIWELWERNGLGEIRWPNGRRYFGSFHYGKRHGFGTMIFPDGRIYTGNFENGNRSGQGLLVFPDGRKYIGEFKDGDRTGYGILINSSGEIEEGHFKDGKFLKEQVVE